MQAESGGMLLVGSVFLSCGLGYVFNFQILTSYIIHHEF